MVESNIGSSRILNRGKLANDQNSLAKDKNNTGNISKEETSEEKLKSQPSQLERSLANNDKDHLNKDSQKSFYDYLEKSVPFLPAAKTIVNPAKDGVEVLGVNDAFKKLNSDGDKLYMRVTAELKGYLRIGLKGQLGTDIEVTQVGNGSDAKYRISLDKESLSVYFQKLGIPYASLKFEAGIQTADRVEMSFDSQTEAIRATKLLQRLAVSDAISDAATSGTYSSLSGGGSNPLANPLTKSGSPGIISKALLGISNQDISFLQSHISAYEQTLGARGRASIEAQLPQLFLPFKTRLEGRRDPRLQVIRRVEMPQGGKPGRLTLTIAGDVTTTVKEKLEISPSQTNRASVRILAQNRIGVGMNRVEMSAHYKIPSREMMRSKSALEGRVLPEKYLMDSGRIGKPDRITYKATNEKRVQGYHDLSRADTEKITVRFDISNPKQSLNALKKLAVGDVKGAAAVAGANLITEFQHINRSGFAVQSGIKLDSGRGEELEATVIVEAGVNDVTKKKADVELPTIGAVPDTEKGSKSNTKEQGVSPEAHIGSAESSKQSKLNGSDKRKSTDKIIQEYQVAADKVIRDWKIKHPDSGIEGILFRAIKIPTIEYLTKTESKLIQELFDRNGIRGIVALKTFNEIVNPSGTDQSINAYRVADRYFPRKDDSGNLIRGGEDGHNNAFCHAFFNAMLTKEFGVGFAASFATAHEGLPGNPADREAMDLFNNELGRRIAVENPNASPRELAKLIHKAIMDGEAVVINRQGELVYSDQEEIGQTGSADDAPINSVKAPPEWAYTGSH
jgi:hypothetical protein